jgi:DNA ligase (NAD+)
MKKPVPIESLSEAQARREHARLGEKIAAHDKRYYTEDAPIVSDAEYDALRLRYEALEAAFPELATPESLTKKIGAAPSEKFAKVRHRVPVLSLGNIFGEEEVADFVTRIRRFLGLSPEAPLAITAEPKIDGLSCSLRYESGKLVAGTDTKARTSQPMCAPSEKFHMCSKARRRRFLRCAAKFI